ncbi:MAG: YcgN family cysteine cluster protein [Pseudomonadales bacterium]
MAEFWQDKKLAELSSEQWEALCDGCGRCCLHKCEDEDSGELQYTRIACHLLDLDSATCRDYTHRLDRVEGCISVAKLQPNQFQWLPSSCAYRLRAEGKPLFDWHYLVSGSKDTVHEVDISVVDKVLSEESVHPDGWDEHIIQWVNE